MIFCYCRWKHLIVLGLLFSWGVCRSQIRASFVEEKTDVKRRSSLLKFDLAIINAGQEDIEFRNASILPYPNPADLSADSGGGIGISSLLFYQDNSDVALQTPERLRTSKPRKILLQKDIPELVTFELDISRMYCVMPTTDYKMVLVFFHPQLPGGKSFSDTLHVEIQYKKPVKVKSVVFKHYQ